MAQQLEEKEREPELEARDRWEYLFTEQEHRGPRLNGGPVGPMYTIYRDERAQGNTVLNSSTNGGAGTIGRG